HAVPTFDRKETRLPTRKKKITYSNVFGKWLCDMANKDKTLTAITPAMREGSDLIAFSRQYKDRYFDVGIAEQHAVTIAAGMACEGLKPVVAIYSSFLQRGYDQLIHDVVLQELDVLFAIDRSGLVGGDGATHHGSFDISFLRCIPNLIIMAPSDELECRKMLTTGFEFKGSAAVRYPRGSGPGIDAGESLEAFEIGKGIVKREGKNVALLAFGSLVNNAMIVAEEIDATVVDMRFVKPLDKDLIIEMSQSHSSIITLEENVIAGGAGSAVSELLAERNIQIPIKHLGIQDKFIEHGDPNDLLKLCELDVDGIKNKISSFVKS
ncbi:MAG: 1-deoxy-D-xylulose-5-phosphate synthase, partial [Kangiellaceae bacterium]|nr:1-deoxy-D-xylulose-5-phosphate synthase [Kangiellaceae bacterium]